MAFLTCIFKYLSNKNDLFRGGDQELQHGVDFTSVGSEFSDKRWGGNLEGAKDKRANFEGVIMESFFNLRMLRSRKRVGRKLALQRF